MTRYLDKFQVGERIGVRPKTAAVLMMEMNPIAVSGKVRKRWRVSEENLDRWMERRMLGKPKNGSVMGSKRRLERR